MQERPDYIEIKGKKVPLWCDIFVLNEIQEKYGPVNVFERKLIGIKEEKEKIIKTEPDIEAIILALELMITEGYKKEEMIMGAAVERKSVEELLMELTIPYEDLSKILHKSFKRCFLSKKSNQEREKEMISR